MRATPFIKWAGGKSKLLSKIDFLFPKNFNHYYEPFLGGGAVFFHLKPQYATLSDTNKELINAYLAIRDNPEKVIENLSFYSNRLRKASKDGEDKDYYYYVRNSERPKIQTSERRAARTIFLNKTCYNGLYRVNSKGVFNVPYGRTATGNLPEIVNQENIIRCSQYLKGVEIQNIDCVQILDFVKEGDFVYLDPPYHAPNKASMYSEIGFTDEKHDEVALLFRKLSDRGAFVMLNNSHTLLDLANKLENIRHLYECTDYHRNMIDSKWSIGARAEWRKKEGELVVTNYISSNELPQDDS